MPRGHHTYTHYRKLSTVLLNHCVAHLRLNILLYVNYSGIKKKFFFKNKYIAGGGHIMVYLIWKTFWQFKIKYIPST